MLVDLGQSQRRREVDIFPGLLGSSEWYPSRHFTLDGSGHCTLSHRGQNQKQLDLSLEREAAARETHSGIVYN